MNAVKTLEQYLEDNYGKCEMKLNIASFAGNFRFFETPKGEVLAHISKDNIISVFKLEKRFGAEEY